MKEKLQKHEDTGWKRINNEVIYRVLNCYCTVIVLSSGGQEIKANVFTKLGRLPQSAYPTVDIEFIPNFAGLVNVGSRGRIDKNGFVEIFASASTTYYGATIVYPI